MPPLFFRCQSDERQINNIKPRQQELCSFSVWQTFLNFRPRAASPALHSSSAAPLCQGLCSCLISEKNGTGTNRIIPLWRIMHRDVPGASVDQSRAVTRNVKCLTDPHRNKLFKSYCSLQLVLSCDGGEHTINLSFPECFVPQVCGESLVLERTAPT